MSHVPPPNPAYFWPFTVGQERMIGMEPYLGFRLDAIHDTWIAGTETVGDITVAGQLHLNRPCVITKNRDGEPMVTLTLRRIEAAQVFLQVTGNPKMKVGWRQ